MTDVVSAAQEKLRRIIDREGDLGGIRRTPVYLYQLIAEETMQREFIAETKRSGRPDKGTAAAYQPTEYSIA
jgi:hypothetical protein